jgi:hypothetical protein
VDVVPARLLTSKNRAHLPLCIQQAAPVRQPPPMHPLRPMLLRPISLDGSGAVRSQKRQLSKPPLGVRRNSDGAAVVRHVVQKWLWCLWVAVLAAATRLVRNATRPLFPSRAQEVSVLLSPRLMVIADSVVTEWLRQ